MHSLHALSGCSGRFSNCIYAHPTTLLQQQQVLKLHTSPLQSHNFLKSKRSNPRVFKLDYDIKVLAGERLYLIRLCVYTPFPKECLHIIYYLEAVAYSLYALTMVEMAVVSLYKL
jgi:hypothetical protein